MLLKIVYKNLIFTLFLLLLVLAGSQFWNPGLFEVTKASQPDEEEGPSSQTDNSSLLEVKVGSDLEGVASVTVSICETETNQETGKGITL